MNDSRQGKFTAKANELLRRLPMLRDWLDLQVSDRRAFIIEFAGMPKAGKSSAIEHLRHFFSHGYKVKVNETVGFTNAPAHQYEVYTPAEGVSLRTPGYLKSDKVDFNTWAGAYGLQELLQASHDKHNDLVVLDRGPWDAGCWLEHWKLEAQGKQNQDDPVAAIAEFFQLDSWTTRSDLHVVLVVDPAQAAFRELNSRLIQHGGFASDQVAMQKMHTIYIERFKLLAAKKRELCPHVGASSALLLDTTELHPHEVTLRIIEATYSVLEGKINERSDDVVLTSEYVSARLEGYLGTTRSSKKQVLEFLPAFVEAANALPTIHRIRLRRLLEEAQAPPTLDLAASAPVGKERVNPLQRQLEELLNRARRT